MLFFSIFVFAIPLTVRMILYIHHNSHKLGDGTNLRERSPEKNSTCSSPELEVVLRNHGLFHIFASREDSVFGNCPTIRRNSKL